MKYVVSWTNRETGNAEKEAKRSLAVFSKWTPSQSSTFHQFVQRVDGEGGSPSSSPTVLRTSCGIFPSSLHGSSTKFFQ